MLNYKYLICVQAKDIETGDELNNNKYYEMKENTDNTFTVKFGRVGSNCQIKIYDISKWDSVYEQKTSKIRNGYVYKDITDLRTEVISDEFKEIGDSQIQSLLNDLNNYSKQSILDNYSVTSQSVNQLQIDEAQLHIEQLSKIAIEKEKFNYLDVNNFLMELYTIIPRKMKKVKDHLLIEKSNKKFLRDKIAIEQDTLDVMAQQVIMNNQIKFNKNITIQDALGIRVEYISNEEEKVILKFMENQSAKFKRAYKVNHIDSLKKFENYKKKKAIKLYIKFLWHGSRNENWLNILKTGLLIRPSCAIQTGAMFGNGIYFANKCETSVGYTSIKGSRYAKGNLNKGYLALYTVNTGIELKTQNHESWMYNLNEEELKSKGNYDSFFTKGGTDSKTSEYIIYNENQCSIKYIVEIV